MMQCTDFLSQTPEVIAAGCIKQSLTTLRLLWRVCKQQTLGFSLEWTDPQFLSGWQRSFQHCGACRSGTEDWSGLSEWGCIAWAVVTNPN